MKRRDVTATQHSGVDMLRNVREAGFRTFVTLISSTRPDDYRRIGRELYAYDYLQKPLTRALTHAVLDAYAETRIGKNILLIDDSATACRQMKRIVERKPIRGRYCRSERWCRRL